MKKRTALTKYLCVLLKIVSDNINSRGTKLSTLRRSLRSVSYSHFYLQRLNSVGIFNFDSYSPNITRIIRIS
jgi:hypothetical protein